MQQPALGWREAPHRLEASYLRLVVTPRRLPATLPLLAAAFLVLQVEEALEAPADFLRGLAVHMGLEEEGPEATLATVVVVVFQRVQD